MTIAVNSMRARHEESDNNHSHLRVMVMTVLMMAMTRTRKRRSILKIPHPLAASGQVIVISCDFPILPCSS